MDNDMFSVKKIINMSTYLGVNKKALCYFLKVLWQHVASMAGNKWFQRRSAARKKLCLLDYLVIFHSIRRQKRLHQ